VELFLVVSDIAAMSLREFIVSASGHFRRNANNRCSDAEDNWFTPEQWKID